MSALAPTAETRNSGPLLQTEHLRREFAGRDVVTDVSLRLRRGEVLGLLGLNGAGKSTTLSMICGVLAPSDGWVRINGQDIGEFPDQARRAIGYLPDVPPLYPELQVKEFLRYCARLHRLKGRAADKAVERALALCQLGEVRDRRLGNLSKGFRQRVGLAQAIVHSPELIVLDEPASGLDPIQMIEMRKLIHSLSEDAGVIFSSHLLPEVTDVCQRVAIIHQGRMVHEETLQGGREHGRYLLTTAAPVQSELLMQVSGVLDARADPSEAGWQLQLTPTGTHTVVSDLVGLGVQITGFMPLGNDLEARFAALTTGRPAGEPA